MLNTTTETKGPLKRRVWLWCVVGLVMCGVLSYLLRTSLNSPAGVREPTVVCFLTGTGEILGIDGATECYRKHLSMRAAGYGVDGHWLVVVGDDLASSNGKSIAVLIDLRSGEVIARKLLNIKMLPRLEGLTKSVLVDATKAKCYLCGSPDLDPGKQELVQIDLGSLTFESFPLKGLYASNTIAIQDDLGFCTSDCVYRFSRPPLAQKVGYDGNKLSQPSFFYTPHSGLFNVNRSLGTVTHLSDVDMHPLVKTVEYPLAGVRIEVNMMALDLERNHLISVGWRTGQASHIQALDLSSGKVVWNQVVAGAVEQIMLGSLGKLYLFEEPSKTFRWLDLTTLMLTDYAKLGDHIPVSGIRVIWAR